MSCSGRVKKADIRADQKWDFISLNDFKSTSCFTPFAYGYLWVSLLISTAVYAVDVFTAVNLLAFNRWSGEVKPIIPFKISKWLFSACIIASWVNLAFEHLRAWHVMRRGAVAESYLDPLAVRLECIKQGKKGRGWKRFLVFAELTKSKKGAEYVALFTYFAFQSWIRIIFCQGPQKAINAITLYSVFKANLDPTTATNVGQGFLDFFQKIEVLASQDHQQAVILSGMVFTLIIWIFGALSLILGVLFYVLFLWHYIPNADGGLSGYCERKINSRLAKIVSAKVNKALEEEERKRRKADQKAIKNGDVPIGRQATIPMLFDAKDDKLPNMPMLSRNDTMATLPLYSSRPGTPSSALPAFELDRLDQKRPLPSRNATGNSNRSYASNASLLGNASDMGYGRPASPAPSLPPLDTSGFPAAPQRTMTNNSQNSPWNRGPPVGPPRMPSAMGDRGYTQSPVSYTDIGSQRSPSAIRKDPIDPYNRPMPGGNPSIPGAASMGRRTPFDPYSPDGRSSPAPGPGVEYGRSSPAPGLSGPPAPQFPSNGNSNYVAYGPEQRSISAAPYNPNQRSASAAPYNMDQRSASAAPYNSNQRSAPAAVPSYASGQGQQFRNMTDPSFRALPSASNGPPLNPQMGAMGMSSSPVNGGRGTPNGSREREGPARLASPAPYVNNLNGRGSPQEYGPSQGGPVGAPRALYRQ